MASNSRVKIKAKLQPAWKALLDEYVEHSHADDTCYESLCIGFCMANGLSADQAIDFYQDMIPEISTRI